MSVSVDRVYQTVLTIVSKGGEKYVTKDGRAYITPQEFNLLANQAEIEVFEEYFYTLERTLARGKTDDDYANTVRNLQEKIRYLQTDANGLRETDDNLFEYPDDFYRLGRVTLNETIADEVSDKEWSYINLSPLTSPTRKQPVYVRRTGGIVMSPGATAENPLALTDSVNMQYVRQPATVVWSGNEMNGQFVQGSSTNFDLHPSEFPELVVKILSYVGILIQRADVSQFAEGQEATIKQNEQ